MIDKRTDCWILAVWTVDPGRRRALPVCACSLSLASQGKAGDSWRAFELARRDEVVRGNGNTSIPVLRRKSPVKRKKTEQEGGS